MIEEGLPPSQLQQKMLQFPFPQQLVLLFAPQHAAAMPVKERNRMEMVEALIAHKRVEVEPQ
jgi:hypothetical protein